MAKSDKILEKKQNQILKEFREMNNIGIIANDEIDLNRIKEILNSNNGQSINKQISRIGIRINPVSGYGRIRATSVSTIDSKFGIVADSNPEREYQETLDKAAAMVEALSKEF